MILTVPKVRIFIGRRRILIIGLSIVSKTVITRATLIRVEMFGENVKFLHISFSVIRQKIIIRKSLKNFFIV